MIFLSHAEEDKEFTDRIFKILDSLMLQPYTYERFPHHGESIQKIIKKNIKECELFIVFLTKDGVKSQWVNQEIGMAKAFGKLIIPVVEKGVKSKGFIELIQHIEFDGTNKDETIHGIIYAVRNRLNPKRIRIECSKCFKEFTRTLFSGSTQEFDIEHGGHWVFDCPKKHQIALSPLTLEVMNKPTEKQKGNKKK